ncbi:MAG: ester cyclase [Syntrophothermus sp.]
MATAETETPSPVDIAREVFETVLNQRDAEALRPYWADDLVEELPTGTYRGPDEMARYFAETFAALPDFHIEPERIAGEGETVFVKWRLTGTFRGAPWQGIEPTGDRIELTGMDCFTLREGKVVHNIVVFDQGSFGRQIGMLPAKDSVGERTMRAAFNVRTKLKHRFARAGG